MALITYLNLPMSCWLSASLSPHLPARMSKSISATIRASSAPSDFLCYLRDDSPATVTTNFTCNIFQFLFHSKTKLPIALRGALRPTKHAEYFIFWEFQQLFFLSFPLSLPPACAPSPSTASQFFHSFLLFCVSRARIKIVFVCGSACWFRLLSEMWNAKWEMENATRGQEEEGVWRGEGEQKERKNLLRVLL